LVGNQLCFQRVEVTLFFDNQRHLIDQEIKHGDFVTSDEGAKAEGGTNGPADV
jgi:hypothetical protein